MIECCWMLLQQLNPIYRDATTTYKNPTFSAAHWRHVTSRPMTIHLPSRSLLGPSYWCCSRDVPMRQSIQCTWFWGHGCWKVGDWAATERAKSHCRLFEFINNNKIIINLYSAVIQKIQRRGWHQVKTVWTGGSWGYWGVVVHSTAGSNVGW